MAIWSQMVPGGEAFTWKEIRPTEPLLAIFSGDLQAFRVLPPTLWTLTDRRIPMSLPHEHHSPQERVPSPNETAVPELEEDQTIAPRPEEEIADVLRAKPDVEDHSQHPE